MVLFRDLFLSLLRAAYENFSILSPYFYIALTLFAVVYYTLGKKLKMQWVLLLLASLLFYLVNGRKAALWIFLPLAVTYFAAHAVTQLDGKIRLRLSALVILFNALFLIYFKEANFFIKNANRILGLLQLPLLSLAERKAPFGVSYITLMLISYYLDVSWGNVRPQKNPLKFVLYALFFPVTTSGPIARYTEVESQLFSEHRFDYEQFCFGVQRIAWGFFKKLVIAERIALIVNTAYSNTNAAGFEIIGGVLLFAFQMYFDFSGCMDMVIGAGKTLGISLPENFTQPFFSKNLSEWWRRWHMTLGFWVKDYMLYPILKSTPMQDFSRLLKEKFGKKNRLAKLLPTWCGMFCVWFFVGFWHGGSWNYIFGSGLFFFFMIALGQALEPVFEQMTKILKIDTKTFAWQTFQQMRTILLFCMSVSFDRAVSLKSGLALWKRIFKHFFTHAQLHDFLNNSLNTMFVILMMIFAFVVDFREFKNKDNYIWQKQIAKQNIVFRWLVYYAVFFLILAFGLYGENFNPSDFIYQGF